MAKLTLAVLVAATINPPNFMYATVKDAAALVKSGDAEQNATAPNPANANEFAIRASDAGIAKYNASIAAGAAPGVASTPSFAIEYGDALDRPKRGGGGRAGSSKYPFADMGAPVDGKTAKIFVPASADMPEPWKSLSSTVSTASRSFAVVTGTKPGKNKNGEMINRNIYKFERKFALVRGKNKDGIEGAFIERIL